MTRNTSGGTVSRIMAISPEQNEMLRRNRSRIFITTARESVIDSVLFAGYRPIEEFIPAAARAIEMYGLKDIAGDGDINLQPAFEHNATAGFMQQHLVSRGWLEDKDNNVVDLIIEVELQGSTIPDVNMKTFDAPNQIEDSSENPLCIFCGIEDLYPESDEYAHPGASGGDERELETANNNQNQDDMVAAGGNGGGDVGGSNGNGNGSGRGRVTRPDDKRLKQNRDQGQNATAMARQGDQGASAGATASTATVSTARMAGKPGRVARPWDGRLKTNRGGRAAEAGGR